MEIILDPHQYNSVVIRVSNRMGEPESISIRTIDPEHDQVTIDLEREQLRFGKDNQMQTLLFESSPYSRQIRQIVCSQNIQRLRMVKMINSKGYIIDKNFLLQGNYMMRINPRTGVAYIIRLSRIDLPTLYDPEISKLEPLGNEYHIQLSALMREGGGLFIGDVNLEEMEIVWIEVEEMDYQLFLEEPFKFL